MQRELLSEESLAAIVAEWSAKLPEATFTGKPDPRTDMAFYSNERVREAMQQQVAMMRDILSRVDLSAGERQELQRSRQVYLPLPR